MIPIAKLTRALSGDKNAFLELLPVLFAKVKPVIELKKAQLITELTDEEKDVSLTLRSKDDIYFYQINAINLDNSTGRILDSGIINDIKLL